MNGSELRRAIAKEEAARDEYDKAILNMRQENQRGMMQLDAIQSLSDFKQKLLSKINVSFLSQAEEVGKDSLYPIHYMFTPLPMLAVPAPKILHSL